MNLTHATYICRDPWDLDTLHVYTRTLVNGKPNGNIYHDYALKIDELDSYWGESGRTLQKECKDEEAFTTLTAIVLSCEVVKRERVGWEGVR